MQKRFHMFPANKVQQQSIPATLTHEGHVDALQYILEKGHTRVLHTAIQRLYVSFFFWYYI